MLPDTTHYCLQKGRSNEGMGDRAEWVFRCVSLSTAVHQAVHLGRVTFCSKLTGCTAWVLHPSEETAPRPSLLCEEEMCTQTAQFKLPIPVGSLKRNASACYFQDIAGLPNH